MVAPLKLYGKILLIWLFVLCHKGSSFKNECWNHMCANDVNHTCICQPQVPHWIVPGICILPLAVFLSCCVKLCVCYCKERHTGNHLEATAITHPTPLPFHVQTPFEFRDPPPYNAIEWKPYCYPSPQDQPPSYDNITMDNLSPPDISIQCGFVPKYESTRA